MTDRKIILAVDDMSENLTLLRSMLEDYFDIRLAKSAKMALTLLDNTVVDLILLDIEMPGMSGFEFLRQLRLVNSKNKDTPVIFVTSHAKADLITQAINSGAKDYLLKPIKADALYKKIDAVIGMPEDKTDPLEKKLKALMSAAVSGDSSRAESIMAELKNHVLGQNVHKRRFVEDIGNFIHAFDYEKGINKIKEFLVYLSLNLPPRPDK